LNSKTIKMMPATTRK